MGDGVSAEYLYFVVLIRSNPAAVQINSRTLTNNATKMAAFSAISAGRPSPNPVMLSSSSVCQNLLQVPVQAGQLFSGEAEHESPAPL